MFRRDFFKRVLAAVGGLCGGASTAAVLAPAGPRQVTTDVRLFRIDPPPRPGAPVTLTPIDWFDQKVGDEIRAVWRRGYKEGWRVTGAPSFTSNKHGPHVETVMVENMGRSYQRTLGFDPAGDVRQLLVEPEDERRFLLERLRLRDPAAHRRLTADLDAALMADRLDAAVRVIPPPV